MDVTRWELICTHREMKEKDWKSLDGIVRDDRYCGWMDEAGFSETLWKDGKVFRL